MRWCWAATVFWTLAIATLSATEPSPIAQWNFDSDDSQQYAIVGDVRRDQPGPRPTEFKDFSATNSAFGFTGDGSRIEVPDPGNESEFDYTNGETITVESWVQVDDIRPGQHRYIIGKGRTGDESFTSNNQNWALRLACVGEQIHVNFLFATEPMPGGDPWHRWTSTASFPVAADWHHVAVSYDFGDPESVRAWIDGIPSDGTWDMGGPTKLPPVVDNDAIWIGSSMGGNPSSSFQGKLDGIAVHRTRLSDSQIASRFNRVGGPRITRPADEVMPKLNVPHGKVIVSLTENFPARNRWRNEAEEIPPETLRFETDHFLLPRIPIRYDAYGIRDNWQAPILIRIAADVELPPGKHRILLRNRELGRLWVDGEIIARTDVVDYVPPNGEEPITPIPEPIHPGVRLPGYHQQEAFGTFTSTSAGVHRVVMECVIGGKGRRTESGEVCVAIESDNKSMFHILQPVGGESGPVSLTDDAVASLLKDINRSLDQFDDLNRRQAASEHNAYWESRHQLARDWHAAHPLEEMPPHEQPGVNHPIDAFISDKVASAVHAAQSVDREKSQHFHEKVLPILRTNCVRCHGDQEQGGLQLDSRETALVGGESGLPAVVPGQVSESELMARIQEADPSIRMPPTGDRLTEGEIELLADWIKSGAEWPAPVVDGAGQTPPPEMNNEEFLRRAYFDAIGLPPAADGIRKFIDDTNPRKREEIIETLLADPRWADQWMGYWQDVLAENPTLLNPSLNSTGPFRWFLYEALRDNKGFDRLVTELIMLRGDPHAGGSAGFALAAENDTPFAAKGHIVASAFLGIELQCARCHDAPYHTTTQRDLYSLAAMFSRKPLTVPKSSTVPVAFFEKQERTPLIQVTLKPDAVIKPQWPFGEELGVNPDQVRVLLRDPSDTREQLAVLTTAPQNTRFAEVIVNRIWARLMGAGLVEPVHDWEGKTPSHPKLLKWLARELATHDYDVKHVMRLIMTSKAYQRRADGRNREASPEQRFFVTSDRRRLSAEQIVDALHFATGNQFAVEELTFVHDGRREESNRLTLGTPDRAWMFASLANERDRPSLALPKAQTVADVLTAFGWNGARQQPRTERDRAPNVLQPGILSNGTLANNLTRASDGSRLAQIAIDAGSPGELVDTIFLQFLSRLPNEKERSIYALPLAKGFESRLLAEKQRKSPPKLTSLPKVTWFNHLQSEANLIQQQIEERIKMGPPPDPRLAPAWRTVYEDFVWTMVNTSEFVWLP